MRSDRITLTVPGRDEYAKAVRMTAAQLATLIGMTYDEVDDVRMAAQEAFVFARDCIGEADTITFTFTVGASTLTVVVGPLPQCEDTSAHRTSEGYAEFILRSVCDEFSIEKTAEGGLMRLVHHASVDRGGAGA